MKRFPLEMYASLELNQCDFPKTGKVISQTPLGDEFTAFANNIAEEEGVLRSTAKALLAVNLGATAIGTGVNTPEGYREEVVRALSEVTGLDIEGSFDLIEATSDTGDYVHAHAAVKRAAMKMSKISNDLRLLSSGPRAGLNEIN